MEFSPAVHSPLSEVISVIVEVLSCIIGIGLGYKRQIGWGMGLLMGFAVPVLGPVLVFFSAKRETLPVKIKKYTSLLDNGQIDEAEYDVLMNSLSKK